MIAFKPRYCVPLKTGDGQSRLPVRCEQGFTLLELMVVIFIIGITLGFAVLSVGDRNREQIVEQEAKRLVARVNLAGQESILESKELALEVRGDGYQFLSFNQQDWSPLADDEVLRARRLPEGISFKLRLEGESVALNGDSELKDGPTLETPRIYLLSSGEMTPFELLVRDAYGSGFRITGAANGSLKLLRIPRAAKT